MPWARRSPGAMTCCSPMTSAACGRSPALPAARRSAAVELVLTAIGVPPAATVDVLSRLADRSLIEVDIGSGGAVRYRLLDSVRAFSLDRLGESDSRDVARGAHAAWVAAAADQAAIGVRKSKQAEHLAVARTERANIDEALAWTSEHDPAAGFAHRQRIRLGLGDPRRRGRGRGSPPKRCGRGPRHGTGS